MPQSINQPLQACKIQELSRGMILRHFHIEIRTGVSKVLGSEDGAFLADQQGRLKSINIEYVPLKRKRKELTLKVLQPTLSGQMDKSHTLRPLTPWTFRRSSTTPCLTMELPSRGAMLHVPRLCQVVSTWRCTETVLVMGSLLFSVA